MSCGWRMTAALGIAPGMQDQLIDILAVVSGIVVIILSTGVAIRTFMVPTGAPPLINRVLFRFTQALFDVIIRPIRSETRRQGVLSLFAPVSLLVVLAVVLGMIGFGYTLALYGAGIKPLLRAFLYSGSALSTLGFESPGNNFWVIVLSAVEALTVVTIVALLIGYLPTIYSSYQQREQAVNNLDELTGSQPDGIKVVDAYVNIFGPSRLGELWQTWLGWFADLATSDRLSRASSTSAPRVGTAPGSARRGRCSMRPRWSSPASISRPIRQPTGWYALVRGRCARSWSHSACVVRTTRSGQKRRSTSASRSSMTPTITCSSQGCR